MDNTATSPIPPDLGPYLDTIADRLLSGHAAVMVGAGFSRNATGPGSGPGFPNWPELGDRFYERLHGHKPDRVRSYLQVPALAHEIEAAFGRPFLDQMLRDAIPDLQHEPSPLHVMLLDLPWTDVFTTNYDTLLERACRSVISQRYDIVIKPEDLGHSKRPRIVKLHGSLPSDRPFIVTDEDYRRYPHDFAPFVNTVRQALLENTLCLIGFSGDDPNFLQWIGWIHDNLGHENSPKMYLVGLLSLSQSQKTLLERRNIIPVDLSRYPGVDGDHHRALEQFLEYLQSRRITDNRLDWPSHGEDDTTPTKEEDPAKIVGIWRLQRRRYPGWVILPEDRRPALWRRTERWTDSLPEIDTLSGSLDLEFAFELAWRMERCLCPIFDSQADFLEATLERYWPHRDTGTSSPLLPTDTNDTEKPALSKDAVRDMCHYLRLALMRYYREDGYTDKWVDACATMQAAMATLSSEHAARLHYERALFALFSLNLQELKTRLDDWPSNDAQPFWAARKAGLLAEVGQTGEAQRILEQSLEAIRTKLNLTPTKTDYALLSQESFVMFLLQTVRQRWLFTSKDPTDTSRQRREFRERWHTLRQYKCDPWHDLELFEHMLARAPATRSSVTETPKFDIGRIVRTRHFGHSDKEALTAYNFLRFCEEAGIPFRIPGVNIAEKSAAGTLTRVAKYSSYWALVTLVRIGDKNVVDEIFDRASLVQMDTPSVDNLVERYLDSLRAAFPDIETRDHQRDGNFGTLLAEIVPEILSRLCCKCSRTAKHKIVDLLLEIYQLEYRRKFRGVRNFTERLLTAFSVDDRVAVISKLLQFPVPTDLHGMEEREFLNPLYFVDFSSKLTSNRSVIPETTLDVFFDKAPSSHPAARKWAVFTLGTLHRLELLDSARSKQFGNVLWSQTGDDGMPSETDYYRHAFLKFPHPVEIDPVALFMQYVRGAQFPTQQSEGSIRIGSTSQVAFCSEIVASKDVPWSDEDVRSIMRRLVEWWDTDKTHLKIRSTERSLLFPSIVDEIKKPLWKLVDTLKTMVARHSDSIDGSVRDTLKRVVEELSEYGLPALRLEMACVSLFPECRDRILSRIEYEMTSTSNDIVVDALSAIDVAADRVVTSTEEHDSDKEDLMRLLRSAGTMVRWRRDAAVSATVCMVANVVKHHPWIFVGDIECSVLLGLHRLVDDTDVSGYGDTRIQGKEGRHEISIKLHIRREAARLAYSLFEHYRQRGEDVPQAVSAWEQICRSEDEFAEIRNQWPNPMPAAC